MQKCNFFIEKLIFATKNSFRTKNVKNSGIFHFGLTFPTKNLKMKTVRNSAQRGAPELSTPPLCSIFRGDFENRHERVRNSKINFGKMTLFPGFRGPGGPTAYARPTNVTPFPGCCTFPIGLYLWVVTGDGAMWLG